MIRSDTISIRLHTAQKEALRTLAATTGQSLSAFVLDAALARASVQLDDVRARALRQSAPAPRRAMSKGKCERSRADPMRFRLPSMPGDYGAPFEEVVRDVALRMHTDAHTIAIALTYFAEGLGGVVAQGRVFRWPGMFVVGPYRVERDPAPFCAPRFQANPPLKELVWVECPPDLGRNRELDAHRRRRRPDRSKSLATFMRQQRHAISLQDLRIIESLDSDWRMSSPTHWT